MDIVPVENGLFYVSDDGHVFRKHGNSLSECPQNGVGRNGKYMIVTAMVDGNQKAFYVHRLVASAFLPNPDNLPQVNHINGNPMDNRVENLEWCTAQQNVQHAYATGLADVRQRMHPCKQCGALTLNRSLCNECRRKNREEKEAEAAKQKRFMREKEIDFSVLTERQSAYAKAWISGLTMQSIANQFGVSRQCVNDAIKRSIRKSKKKCPARCYQHRTGQGT